MCMVGPCPSGTYVFQSSPGTLTGCNSLGRRSGADSTPFQSSPGTLTGCNGAGFGAGSGTGMFQSSPGTLTGCNARLIAAIAPALFVFQSSPGTLTGCNVPRLCLRQCLHDVSILTRHADRVQPASKNCPLPAFSRFQSSPGTLTGCNAAWPPCPCPR